MANMFEKYAADHEVEQKIEDVTGTATNEKHTALSLSLTVGGKKSLR